MFFKNRKKNKEIDTMVKEVYTTIPQEEQIQLFKDSGLSAEKTAAIVKVASGAKNAGKNVNFTRNDIDLVLKRALTEIKGPIQELNGFLHFSEGAFSDLLAEDAFELISMLSLMSIQQTDFQVYCIQYYNFVFDKSVDSDDIKGYLRLNGLGNVYVSNRTEFICSDDEWKRIENIADRTPKGLKSLHKYFAVEGFNIDYMEITLKLYQTVISMMSSVCENYPGDLQTNFIVMLNNWLLSVAEFIPESLLSKDFVLNLKRINTEMHKYDD